MKKIICFLTGHRFLYGEYKGMQNQPTKRACKRCKKVEQFKGSMARWPGTFGQLWYSSEDWYTEQRWKQYCEKEESKKNKFDELTK